MTRGHHEGSLYLRKRDNRWVAAVTMPDGSRPSRSAPDKAEARRLLRELLRKRDHGLSAGRDESLGRFLERWLADVRPRLAPKTWHRHEQIIRVHIVPAIGRRSLSGLSVGDVRSFLAGASGSAQTLRHYRATLRRALADAQREGLVVRNVAALAEPPPMKRKERTVLTAEQARMVIDGTKDDRLHALYVLFLTTGMREAEALALTWKDIHWGDDEGPDELHRRSDQRAVGALGASAEPPVSADGRRHRGSQGGHPRAVRADRGMAQSATISITRTLHRSHPGDYDYDPADPWVFRPTKTDRSRRTVNIPPVTEAALRDHRRKQLEERAAMGELGGEGLVFVSTRGHPIHGENLLPGWYAHLERLGLPKVRLHDLRHSAATILYGMGIPLETIADLLGHSTTRVTADLYRHRVPALQTQAAEAMQRAVGDK
jgi:integrase